MNIKTDEDLITAIDELKHNLKTGIPYSPMKAEFNAMLNAFISKWKLDGDPHAFATPPRRFVEGVEYPVLNGPQTGRFSCAEPNLAAKPGEDISQLPAMGNLWPGMYTAPGIFPENGHFIVFITNVDAETTSWWKARKPGESVWVPLYGRHTIIRVYMHEELNGCCKRIDIEVSKFRGDDRFSRPTELPRIPEGHPHAGYINNCALANGEDEASCQMCGGNCPDRARFAKEDA